MMTRQRSFAMEEQQIDPIPGLVDTQPALPSNEGEPFAQLQQKILQPLDQRGLKIGFGILVLEVQELQHIGVFDRIVRPDGILRPRRCALDQHRRLVLGQGRAFVELAANLPV